MTPGVLTAMVGGVVTIPGGGVCRRVHSELICPWPQARGQDPVLLPESLSWQELVGSGVQLGTSEDPLTTSALSLVVGCW